MSAKIWGAIGLGVVLALIIALILMARNGQIGQAEKPAQTVVVESTSRTEDQMKDKTLACDFEIVPASDGEFGMDFTLRNPNNYSVEVHYFKPYADFTLTAEADDGPVPLVQPAYDVGVQPADLTIEASGEARIMTPIRLRFDPNVAPSGGNVATLWTLRHVPAPVQLRAELRLGGAKVETCEAHRDPVAMK